MKYVFNFEHKERPIQFNREKLLLAAMQEPEQLYYMMDTQYEGIYQAEAVERRRTYGSNSYRLLVKKSGYKFLADRRAKIVDAMTRLAQQKISVFRRGFHFYSEVEPDDLVPGDVVFISPGDIVPSDIRIVFSNNLEVDQSIYTGSKQSIPKVSNCQNARITPEALTSLPDICFAGSLVVKGLGRGVVVSTGSSTYLSHLLLL